MTTTMTDATTSAETRAGINARIAEVNARIRGLIEEQGQLALAAAEGDTDAPKLLADGEAEVSSLTRERRMLERALEVLTARERKADLTESLANIGANRDAAHATIQAVRPCLQRVSDLLADLGPAWEALNAAQIAARQTEAQLRLATHNDVVTGGVTALLGTSSSIDAMLIAKGLLWRAIGDAEGDRRMANAAPEWLDDQIAKSLRLIDEGLARQEQEIRKQLGDDGE